MSARPGPPHGAVEPTDPLQDAVLGGGFADPARDSQRVFRALLAALSEPGTVHTVPAVAAPPAPFPPVMGALALALCDGDTPVLVDPAFGGAAARWVAFHTGAPLAARREEARFAFLTAPDLAGFAVGTDAYPDRSATVIAATRLSGAAWDLDGPGVAGRRTVRVDMPDGFCDRLAENRALFPRGVDLVLCDGAALTGLPRTTRVRPAGEAGRDGG